MASLTTQTLVTTPAVRAPTTLNTYTDAQSSPTLSITQYIVDVFPIFVANGGAQVIGGLSSS